MKRARTTRTISYFREDKTLYTVPSGTVLTLYGYKEMPKDEQKAFRGMKKREGGQLLFFKGEGKWRAINRNWVERIK